MKVLQDRWWWEAVNLKTWDMVLEKFTLTRKGFLELCEERQGNQRRKGHRG